MYIYYIYTLYTLNDLLVDLPSSNVAGRHGTSWISAMAPGIAKMSTTS